MLIRFEKYSLYFLQQLGESNFVQTASLGRLEKTIWKWLLFFFFLVFLSLQQAYLLLAGKFWNKGKVKACILFYLFSSSCTLNALSFFLWQLYILCQIPFYCATENIRKCGLLFFLGLCHREHLAVTNVENASRRKTQHYYANFY